MRVYLALLAACILANHCRDAQVSNKAELLKAYQAKIKALFVKYQKLAPTSPRSDSIPWPKINGPRSKDARIGIVGAGPAGIDMAYKLKKAGYADVTILERSNRAGGKSEVLAHNGATNPLSTYLASIDYTETFMKVAKEFGLYDGKPFTPTLLTENNKDSPRLQPIDFLMANKPLELAKEAEKYIDLHWSLFGKYVGEVMNEPCQEVKDKVKGSFKDFLVNHGMKNLANVLNYRITLGGYNPIYRLSAIQGLMWITPRYLLFGIVSGQSTGMKHGMTDVFMEMIKRQKIDIVYNFDVRNIYHADDSGDEITVETDDPREDSHTFDFLIWTGLLRDYALYSDDDLLSQDMRTILEGQFTVPATGSVVDMRGDYREAAANIYMKQLVGKEFDNQVMGSLDNYAEHKNITKEDYKKRNYTINGRDADVRTLTVFQYGWKRIPTKQELTKGIKDFYTKNFGATEVDVLSQVTVEYFPQWPISMVDEGVHWRIFDAQGLNNVWFSGGGLSWETTKSVMEYNNLLLRQADIPIL